MFCRNINHTQLHSIHSTTSSCPPPDFFHNVEILALNPLDPHALNPLDHQFPRPPAKSGHKKTRMARTMRARTKTGRDENGTGAKKPGKLSLPGLVGWGVIYLM